jgi:glycosyltransferase involved in cell wall biosynthesis
MATNQVLIISFWNPTTENPQQGIFIQEQAAAICNICYNFVFLQVNVLKSNSPFLKKSVEESDFYKGRKIRINLYSFFWKFLYVNPWFLAGLIHRIIKKSETKIKPEIIHASVIHPCGIVGYLLSEKMNTRLLISEHWSKAEKFLRHPVYRNIALNAYRKSFAIICVSEFLSHKISNATGHPNIAVVPNIIDTGIFSFKPKTTVDNLKLSFMCVASWRPPKRLDIIFDALCKYAIETDRQIDLKIVGTGPQAEALKMRQTPENLKIYWYGYLDKSEIAGLLHETTVFLHASDTETFSIVTAEALSTGTPVIASNAGALPELINEKNGALAENNPESWVQCIRKSAAKHFDHEEISIQNQTKYSAEKVGNSIISIYKNAVENQE